MKTERIPVLMSPEMRSEIIELAWKRRVSVAELIRQLIEKELKKEKRSK